MQRRLGVRLARLELLRGVRLTVMMDSQRRSAAGTTSKSAPVPSKIVKELEDLHSRLHIAYCSATTIRLALRNGLENADEDVGTNMERHVIDEVSEILGQLESIVV